MSKKCSKCGNIMEDAVKYCPQCGNYMMGFDDEQTMLLSEDMKPNQDARNRSERSNPVDYGPRQNYQESSGTGYQNSFGDGYQQSYRGQSADYRNPSDSGYGYQNNDYANPYGRNASQRSYGVEESGLLISYKKFWKNYVNFSGRSRRSDFWWVMLVNMIIYIILYAIIMGCVYTAPGLAMTCSVLLGIYAIACFVPMIALYVRRLHDIGKPGLYLLFIFIPFVGEIILIIWCCKDSVPGSNLWGPNPKGIN